MLRSTRSSLLVLSALVSFASIASLTGCGGSGKPTVSIGSPASTKIDPGDSVTLTATVENSSGEGVNWALTGTGCSGSACGALSNQGSTSVTYTAPGTVTTAFTVTVTATSVKDSSVTNSVMLSIPTNPAITTALGALTAGQVGSTYSVTIAPSGGISPYTWTVKSGNLPTGVTLGSSTGTISGIPTAIGNYTFTLQVTDSGTPKTLTASGQFTIDIAAAPAIVFSTTSLPNGTVGTIYSSSVSATGGAGALTYAVTSGSLPAGLSLASSGAITGTPTSAGATSFKVTASDAYDDTGSATFAITINYPQLAVTTSTLPTGYVGTAYPSTSLAASGGSNSGYSWTWAAATGSFLPGGLSLSSAGMVSGKPTSAGTFSVVATVKDSASNTANATLSVTVDPAVTVTTASLPNGYANSVYPNTTLAASGGAGSPYAWTWAAASGSSLPAGLSLSGAGVISGTPTTAGAYSVVVTAEDSAKNARSAILTLTVDAGITISTTSLPGGYQGTPYVSTTLTATGGSGTGYAWTWAAASGSSLPAGLNLSGAGVITGTPTAAGTYSAVVTVKDPANNSAQATFSITVEGTIAITTTTLPTGYANTAYPSTTLSATGGSGGFTWTWAAAGGSSIPPGLSLSTSGVITGTPTTAGTYNVVVTAKDSAGHTQTAALMVTVDAGVSVTTTSLPAGFVNSAYTATTLAATGGAGAPYTWTWAAGSGSSLPAGLSISTAGVITGTPTTAGMYSVVVTAKDSAANTGNATFSVTIKGAVSITTASLPNGYQNTAYTATQLAATGGSGPGYTWTWVAGSGSSIPTGLSLSAGGLITGTPTTPGNYSVVVTAKDSANNTGSATFSIVVDSKLSFMPTTMPTGAVSEVYPSTTLTPAGGSGSGYSFSASGMPPGLVVSAAGVISGTPTTQGTYSSVVVRLKDSASNSGNTTLSIIVNASLAITTSSPLPNGIVSTPYSQQLAATGGSGTLTWTASSSNLAGFALALSGSGLVSGTPNGPGTVNFTANVKDGSGATASVPFTFTIYSALQQNPTGLPATATTSVTYSGTISGIGGSGNYCWSVTGLSDGLTAPANNAPCGYASSSITISGTPTSATNVVFTVKLTDTTTSTFISDGYTIVVSNPQSLTLPAPEPSSLPSATVNQGYNGSITASGGVGPGFTWTVDGNGISMPGLSVSIGDGLSATTNDNNVLTITGTPTSTTPSSSPISFSVLVADNYGHSASQDYSIAVNNVSTINGQIFPINFYNCGGGSVTLPTFAISINTTPVQVTSTDGNGNYSFSNIPNGTYTITPSITGAESVFYPATISGVVINDDSATGQNFGASIGYTVTGNVSYAGAFSGTTYINLQASGCGGGNGYPGVSIPQTTLSGGGAYTIRGVPPGDYTMTAWMDPLAQGQQNTEDPTGSAALVVSTNNVTGADITMTTPTQTAPSQVPKFKAIAPINLGAVLSYGNGSVENSNGVEVFTSYVIQWSKSTTGFSTSNSITLGAKGGHSNVWFLNNGTKTISGSFTNGQAYYFRVQGLNPAGAGPWTYYGGPNVVCNTTTCATTVTIGAPSGTGYNTVTGTVTIPSSITPTGPLYVGYFDQNTNTAYAAYIASPSNSTPNNFTVEVPNGTEYFFFGLLDQNSDGQIDVGDVSNTDNGSGNNQAVTVSGPMSNQELTLPTDASYVNVTTSDNQNVNPSGTNTSYGIGLNVRSGNGSKLPVNVTLTSGPNVLHPIDMGNSCQNCGTPQWQYDPNLDNAIPRVGDSYSFHITYSDTTSETITAPVTAVLGSSVSNLAPNPATASPSTTPTFTWTYPANPGNYTYQFYMQQNNGPTIWQIPGNNSNVNGFTNTQIPMPSGLVYGTDPTDNTNTPLYSTLSSGVIYNWSIQAQDSNGNSASVSTYFTPQ